MTVEIRAVTSARARRRFRDLPALLHGHDPSFVPMLDAVLRHQFSPRNPFWKEARSREWLAWRGDRVVGRVGACLDPALWKRAQGTGAVGFFDAIDDGAVAAALFTAAGEWLKEQGCTRARGPLNYSIHDTAGLLVEGFDTPPTVDTTWNPSYYDALWGSWESVRDLLGAAGDLPGGVPPRARRFAERMLRRGIEVRPMRHFARDAELIREVYNAAWDENWGHVHISAPEFAYKAADMRAVLDPALVRIAEHGGTPVGFVLGLPDLNVPIQRSGGKLLPWGWLRLLRARRTVSRFRIVAMGVRPGHRIRGVEALLLRSLLEAIGDHYTWAEASWILEENAALLNGVGLYGLVPYKRWRLYERDL